MPRVPEIDNVTLARLNDAYPDRGIGLEAPSRLTRTLGVVTRASRFLTRLLFAEPRALDVLNDLDKRPPVDDTSPEALSSWKQLELARIAARDLLGIDSLENVGLALTRLAEDVLASALRLENAEGRLAVISMGKLAGAELNYASDIDVMFVGDAPDALARDVLDISRRCFRTDAALRPEGRDGPLVRTVESYDAYWAKWARNWEFQALLKARACAGSAEIGTTWENAARTALWSRHFGADELRELRDLKARSESLLAQRGLTRREVKRGHGGIRDIEFSVQLLQLVHGQRDSSIRSPNTLTALADLTEGGYIARDDAVMLSDCYRFMRTVEHRLQLVEDEQTHVVPEDREARVSLARVLGYDDTPERSAVEAFETDLRNYQVRARSAHERLYFRPLLEAFAGKETLDERVEERLSAFGFTDAERTRQAVAELTRGLARSSRLMQQLMPLLLEWLAESPNPDQGLLGLRSLVAGFKTPEHVVSVFRDTPEAAQRLCLLLGTGQQFTQLLARHPEVLDDLGRDSALTDASSAYERMGKALEWRPRGTSRHDALVRLNRSERLRIAAADVVGLVTGADAALRRSDVARATLQLALENMEISMPVALIGLGRLGGGELAYSSDIDLIVVHGGTSHSVQAEAERFAQSFLNVVGGETPAGAMYRLDYGLRPEGKNGVLASSIDRVREYYGKWGQTWERQAMVRARFVAGDTGLGEAFMDAVGTFVWEEPIGATELREIRHLKARMERERIPKGQDPRFNLKLGPGALSDVEWTTQLLQLRHHLDEPNTVAALHALEAMGAIARAERETLEEAWRSCDHIRNRWYLVNGSENDTMPNVMSGLAYLARSLDLSSEELRERHLQVARRARTVMERLFYGKTDR